MEQEQFKKEVLPLRERLIFYAERLLENKSDVEDIIQEVFFKLWNMRDELSNYKSVDALSITMTKTKHLCLNRLKANKRERELYDFFSSENIPEPLLPYRPIFAYFETGIKEESGHQIIIQLPRNKRIKIWASIAASLLILISFGIYHFTKGKDYNPYEGSYIVRNGVKITDPKIVNPEIEKTLYLVQQQEKKRGQLLQQLQGINREDPYEQAVKEIKQRHLKWIEQVKDENIRKEITEKINIDL